jgi:hypothetical protein
MGSQGSKLEQYPQQVNESKESVLTESVPSSPILTPLDPRSPSVNIARTPLELILASATNKEACDAMEEDNVETKDLVNVILGIDPRSPTVEFNRTPIIVGTVPKETTLKLQNKNLDNVRKSIIQTTPVTTGRKPASVPPKLLGSSPISVISNYNKRKSFAGLLETNIDFTETDLDTVCQAKDDLNKSLPVNIKDLPFNNLKNQMEALQIDGTECNLPMKEDTIEDVLKKDKFSREQTELQLNSDDKGLTEKTINVTAQVKDFDKKLTNLIYQDESEEDDNKLSVRFSKIKENNRTPLSVRNANEEPKKIRLKVSDKPRKSDNSKIPVFKDNYGKKIIVQCENTPPMKMEDTKVKSKSSHWDADKTLII